MRRPTKAWWMSCSRTLGLMTENSWNHVCETGQSKAISITFIWHVDGRLHITAKWKQTVLREVFERPACPLETYKVRNDGNCRDHSGSQMACKNQTAIRCKLQVMQKGTRTTRCEHWKFAGGVVWHINSAFYDGIATTVTAAHHFIWRRLYASMQAAQTPASKLRFVTPDKESSMNTLRQEKEFEQICSRESPTEKAAEIEQTISVKEHESVSLWFRPDNVLWKLFLESEVTWHCD